MGLSSSALPEWLQWLQALAVLFIAGIGAWIAYRQMNIADTKLQHDLYDRRYRIFDAARRLLSEPISEESIRLFMLGAGDAPFLLSYDINKYLAEILESARMLFGNNCAAADLPFDHPERAAVIAKAWEHQKWIVNQHDILVDKFRTTLTLDKRQRTGRRWFRRLVCR